MLLSSLSHLTSAVNGQCIIVVGSCFEGSLVVVCLCTVKMVTLSVTEPIGVCLRPLRVNYETLFSELKLFGMTMGHR